MAIMNDSPTILNGQLNKITCLQNGSKMLIATFYFSLYKSV